MIPNGGQSLACKAVKAYGNGSREVRSWAAFSLDESSCNLAIRRRTKDMKTVQATRYECSTMG